MNVTDLEERLRLVGDPQTGYVGRCPSCSGHDFLVVQVIGRQAVLSCAAGCDLAAVLSGAGLDYEDLDDLDGLPAREPEKPGDGDEKGSRFGAKEVFYAARERYSLGRTPDGLAFAVPKDTTAPRIAREIPSIRGDLSRFLVEERGILLRRETMKTALDTLEAYAETEGVREVGLRAVEEHGRVTLDLATPDGTVVVVTRDGWDVSSPRADLPIFRRTAATTPLPAPTRGGSLDVLRDLLGLDADDDRWLLLRGWLLASLFEKRPRPILWALGPQGSGKSTRARMLRNVVDPVGALGREPGKNEKDDTTNAYGRFVPSFDNLSTVSTATSDWLCRLVTGVEVTRRALWTNDDLRTSTFRRTAVATSIVLPHGLKADAVERLAVVDFDRVPEEERRTETSLWRAFEDGHAAMLGALLDLVSGVLAHLPDVQAERRPLPRMGDYAVVLLALDRALGLAEDAGHFEAYRRNVGAGMAERAHEDPTIAAVIRLVDAYGGSWSGNATSLREGVKHLLEDGDWTAPKSGRGMVAALKTAEESLRAAGYVTEYQAHGRRYTIRRSGAEESGPSRLASRLDAESVTVDGSTVTVGGASVTVAPRASRLSRSSGDSDVLLSPKEEGEEGRPSRPSPREHNSARETVTTVTTVTSSGPSLDEVLGDRPADPAHFERLDAARS